MAPHLGDHDPGADGRLMVDAVVLSRRERNTCRTGLRRAEIEDETVEGTWLVRPRLHLAAPKPVESGAARVRGAARSVPLHIPPDPEPIRARRRSVRRRVHASVG